MLDVPAPVKSIAARALVAHKENALPETHGIQIAERLVDGTATLQDVAKIHRFFLVNERHFRVDDQMMRTVDDHAGVRSWFLHGGDPARVWAARVVTQNKEESAYGGESVDDLFTRSPDELYDIFSLGAWRFEYGLNVRKAARFVEDYHRATGFILDLHRAFGESAASIGNSMYRRAISTNPYKVITECLKVQDDDIRFAANLDLAEMNFGGGRLDEAFFYKAQNKPPQVLAKQVWAPFIAYFILATENPALIVELNKSSKKPPLAGGKVPPMRQMHDTFNIATMYFHPEGKHYKDPTGTDFEDVDTEIQDALMRSWYGRKLYPKAVQKMLGKARRWTAENKLAGSLFHVFNADWKKGNWQHILDSIPPDSDIHGPFKAFVDTNPLPQDGLKLQQTLSDTPTKNFIKSALEKVNADTPIKLNATLSGTVAAEANTPIGVWTLFSWQGNTYELLGAYKSGSTGDALILFRPHDVPKDPSKINTIMDTAFASSLKSGEIKILLAHKDMPGSFYGPGPASADATMPSVQGNVDPAVVAYVNEKFGPVSGNPPMYSFVGFATDAYASAFGEDLGAGASLWLSLPSGAILIEFVGLVPYSQDSGGVSKKVAVFRTQSTPDVTGTDGVSYLVMSPDRVESNIDSGLLYPDAPPDEVPSVQLDPVPPPAPTPPPMQYPSHTILRRDSDDTIFITFTSNEHEWVQAIIDDGSFSNAKFPLVVASKGSAMASYGTATSLVLFASLVRDAITDGSYGPQELLEDPEWLKPGVALDVQGTQSIYIGVLNVGQSGRVLLAQKSKGGDVLFRIDNSWSVQGLQGYLQPALLAPEPSSASPTVNVGSSEPDAEQGDPEMSGTQDAFDFLEKKNWEPAVASESPEFTWPLGVVLYYKGGPNRTIIGYGFRPTEVVGSKEPIYVIRTEKGNINYKQAKSGNKSYGPLHDVITIALLPKPGLPAPAFPKLNYKLGSTAKAWAKKTGTVFVPADPTALASADHHVGAVLANSEHSYLRYLGWVSQNGALRAVVVTKDQSKVFYWTVEQLNDAIINYETPFVADAVASTYDFSKQPLAPLVTVSTGVATLPSTPKDSWMEVEGVSEPLLPESTAGKHVSAGVLVVFPAGTSVAHGGTSESADGNMVMLFKPLGNFGGYKLAIPKGTLDPGEPAYKAAMREVFEETGVATKLVAYLGDYHANTSVTRLYVGYAISGDIQKMKPKSEECDAVVFRPISSDPGEFLPWMHDLKPDSGNTWQQKAIQDLAEWVATNGVPHLVAAAPAKPQNPQATSVTAAEVPGTSANKIKGAPLGIPVPPETFTDHDLYEPKPIDYPLDALDWASAGKVAANLGAAVVSWSFYPRVAMLAGGYPPPGASVELVGSKVAQDLKGPATILSYVWFTMKSGGGATFVVLRRPDGQVLQLAVFITGNVLLTPESFKPLSTAAQTSEVHVGYGSSTANWDAFWKKFIYEATFPISASMVQAAKAWSKSVSEGTPTGFTFQKSAVGGPQYGDFFYYAEEGKGDVGYIAAGYFQLQFDGMVGPQTVLLFAMTTSGLISILPASPTDLESMRVDLDQTQANAGTVAWFTVPDAKANAVMKQIAVSSSLNGVTLTQFKKWLKDAKFPNWSVVTAAMVPYVAALFVAGLVSEFQKDALLSYIKERMKWSQKKVTVTDASVPTPTPTPADGLVQTDTMSIEVKTPKFDTLPTVSLPFDSAVVKGYVLNPPQGLFAATSKVVGGGSKPNMVLKGPAGLNYFFKYAPGEDYRAHIDKAAYLIMEQVKPGNVPVGTLEVDGVLGSVQPLIEDAVSPPSDPSDLNEAQMTELLAQHAYDMFAGDHDGHIGNWLVSNGRLVAIDRGQSFKFLIQNKPESLDPNWHAPGNYGDGYAKRLLRQWSVGEVAIPDVAFAAMAKVIGKVLGLSDDLLSAALAPAFDSLTLTKAAQNAVLKRIKARRDGYADAWTDTLTKLRADFQWPVAPTKKVATLATAPVSATAAEQGIDSKLEAELSKAPTFGPRGKAMKFDKAFVENQDIVVRACKQTKDGVEYDATLLQWRMSTLGAQRGVPTMMASAGIVAGDSTSSGPQPLKVDLQGNFWGDILSAVKSINYHLVDKPDGVPNKKSVDIAVGHRPALEALAAKTSKDLKGKTDGEPNEAINAMAQQYLQYIEIVQFWYDNAPDFTATDGNPGKKTIEMVQFKFEEPPERRRDKALKPVAYKITYASTGARLPNGQVGADGLLRIADLNSPVHNVGSTPRFQITDKTGLLIQVIPPEMSKPNIKVDTRGHRGICWAIVPGAPSGNTVAKVLKVFEQATGLSMKAATPKDNEILYYTSQAALTLGGGIVTPSPSGTIEGANSELQAVLKLYADGKEDEALAQAKALVANNLGVSGPLESLPGFSLEPTYESAGNGYPRHTRLGWTRAKLEQKLGTDVYLAHHLTTVSSLGFLKQAEKNLALVANNVRIYQGVHAGGASQSSDYNSGGTQGVFCCWRKASKGSFYTDHMYFDISVGLRLDVYQVGTGDEYGRDSATRYLSPDKWKADTGVVGASSSRQISARHDIDLRTYLRFLVFGNTQDHDAAIAFANARGWRFWNNQTPEQTFIVN